MGDICIYIWEYCSAIKKNEILPFAMTWMELEYIMPSEVSQSEKDKYHDFTHMWNLRNKTDKHLGSGEGGREGNKAQDTLFLF